MNRHTHAAAPRRGLTRRRGPRLFLAAGTALLMSVALSAGAVAGHAATRTRIHRDQMPFTLASGTVNNNGLDTNTSFCYEPSPLPTAITNDPVSPTCTPPPADPSAVNPFDIATPYAGWAAPLAGSTWVGPQANGQDNQEQVPGWYIYDADFNGCAELSGNVLADNDVGVFLNGQLISDKVNAFGNPPLSFTGLTTNTGLNIIDFVVYDASAPATGLDYSITVTPTNCSEFPVPAVGLVKSASIQSYSATGAGTTITYTYTVTNTGDVTLSPLTVTDPMTGLSAINCGGSGSSVIPSLAPGASETCTATYTITGANVKAGSITNVGTVTGTTPAGSTVDYNSSLTIPEKGKPFTCNTPTSFLSQSLTGPATQLGASHYLFNAALFNAVGPPYPHNYNALGFDTANDYLYAMRSIGATNTLIRIDAAGNVTVPAGVSPSPTGAMYVGAFDNSGDYWVTRGGGSTVAYQINLATGAIVQTVTLSQKFLPYDWSLDGVTPGSPTQNYFWGLSGSKLYRVELPAGTVTIYPLPASPPVAPGTYGAAWTFSNGDLGFDNNATGQIDRVTVTAPTAAATAAVVSHYYGTGTGFKSNVNVNDGAACSAAGTDLSIVKTGPATVTPGGTITWTITVTNNGPGNSSGFVVDDDAPAGVTNFTTSTPGCSIAGKPAMVQCAEGELDNGDTFTITVTGTAPQNADACVVNTATVSANETDPNPGNNTSSFQTCVQPGAGDIAGVGDGVTAPLFDQFSGDYNATPPSADLASFDAVNPYTGMSGDSIVTKTGCASILRPDSSGAGLSTLEANTADGSNYCVDFARSSRARTSADPACAAGGVCFVSLAGDAVTWATRDTASGGTDAPSNLTTAQLAEIYTCKATDWSQVGGKKGAIQAFLPETSSDTRSSFLLALGIVTPGPCVSDLATGSDPGGTLAENEGINSALDSPTAIVPYSVGVYLAQSYRSPQCTNAGCAEVGPSTPLCTPAAGQNQFGCDETGVLGLNTINGSKPTTLWPLTAATKTAQISTGFVVTFQRTLYDVVRYDPNTADHIPGSEPGSPGGLDLEQVLGSGGWLCTNATAQTDIENYGFLATWPLSSCGAVS